MVSVDAPVIVTAAPLRSIAPVVVIDAPSEIGAVALETVKLVRAVVPPIAPLMLTVPVPLLTARVCPPFTVPPNVTLEFVVVTTDAPPNVIAPFPKSIAFVVVTLEFRLIGADVAATVKLNSSKVPPTAPVNVIAPPPDADRVNALAVV